MFTDTNFVYKSKQTGLYKVIQMYREEIFGNISKDFFQYFST
jgi:hypothetical protein